MKKHTVIKRECEENYKAIKEIEELIHGKERNQKMILDSMFSTKEGRKALKEDEAYQELRNELVSLYLKRDILEEQQTVLGSNYEYAVCKFVIPIICEVMNKYLGKRVGEKTTDKIRNEVYEKTGFRFYWSSQYSCRLSIYNNGNLRIELYVYWDNSDINSFFVEELTEGKIRIHDNYVEDVETYVKQMREERQQLKQAMENLNQMIDKYNEKCVGNMHHYSRYYDR